MLTENELKWLERRERLEFPFCLSCGAVRTAVDGVGFCYPIEDCPLEARLKDWQEAAEFEARVAARLAEFGECPSWFPMQCVGNMSVPCNWCKLKAARLQVEEEMDAPVLHS